MTNLRQATNYILRFCPFSFIVSTKLILIV